jgi:hypothetical protein
VAGLIVAALIDRRRGAYFRSAAPWVSVVAGIVVLAPHIAWLVHHDFAPFGYAVTVHGDKSFLSIAIKAFGYLAGSAGYAAIPIVVVLGTTRPNSATIADMAWPTDTERRLAAAAFWGPLLLPAAGALASGIALNSLWSMPAWTLLPVLLLSPAAVTIAAVDTRRILIAAVAIPLLMLIASPVIAIIAQRNGPAPARAQASLLAAQFERAWHEVTPQPLRFVGGETDIAYGIIAYANERPRALPGMLQPSDAELTYAGMALVCIAEDKDCRQAAEALAARIGPSRQIGTEIVHNYLGFAGRPQRYTVLLVPPQP